MTGTKLKLLAITTMMIDHVGAVLFPQLFVLRIIGRLAFPIFAFLMVQGFIHTSNRRSYALRLLAFAMISEVPFDLAFFGTPFYMGYQNIFFTLFLGLVGLIIYEKVMVKSPFMALGSYILIAYVSEMIHCDYGILGVATFFLAYKYRDNLKQSIITIALLHFVYGLMGTGILEGRFNLMGGGQGLASMAILPLWFYNGQRGRDFNLKYAFYAFYPIHLTVLAYLAGNIM